MGVKKRQFVSKNGHTYEVSLSGTNVGNADILLGVPPVVISMAAGEHKFCGFKSTTAVVNILTDVPLVDLYASGVRDIRLTVEDKTASTVEFDGYVTPFSFDQPYTGGLDSVQVNAVDLVTARKEVKYENIGEVHGVDRTATEIVESIALRSGLTRIVGHVNFNWEEDQGANPLDVMVAQAGFLQDEVSDCDALSAICKFFGYTACAMGDTLYLYDEHAMLYAKDEYRTLCNYSEYVAERGMWVDFGRMVDSPLALQLLDDIQNDISVSIERAFDGIQITPEGSEVSVLLPDVCSDENVEENTNNLGTYTRELRVAPPLGIGYVQYRTPIGSKVMTLGVSGGPVGAFISKNFNLDNGDPLMPNNYGEEFPDGMNAYAAILFKILHAKVINKANVDYPEVTKKGNVIWIQDARPVLRDNVFTGEQNGEYRYSHTGGYIKVSLSWYDTSHDNWGDVEMPIVYEEKTEMSANFLNICCGDSIFNGFSTIRGVAKWSREGYSSLLCDASSRSLLSTPDGMRFYRSECVIQIPHGGQVYANLRWGGIAMGRSASSNIYITSMSIEGVGESIDNKAPGMRHEYTTDAKDVLTVSGMTTRASGSKSPGSFGVNARPGVVTGTLWNGSYLGIASKNEAIPISGIVMEQLKARYCQPRAAYKMTARKNIKPFAAVEWNGKTYTVEAYDRDIYDDTTTITID